MTSLQLASLFNGVGLAVTIFLTVFVRLRYSSHIFRLWTGAYMAIAGIWVAEFLATFIERSVLLDALELVVTTAAAGFLLATAQAISDRRPLAATWRTLLAILGALAVLLRLGGVSFLVAGAIPLVLYIGAYFWLGWVLVARSRQFPGSRSWLLGLPVFVFALSMLLYPALAATPYFLIGFALSGLLQLLIGVGMVIFLLEESAQRLTTQNEELQRVDQIKSRLLATVSHELRTPLTGIRGFLELIEDQAYGPTTEPQNHALRQAGKNAALLQEMIESMLNTAQSDSFALPLSLGAVEAQQAVLETLEALAPMVGEKQLEMVYDMPPRTLWAKADRLRLIQVLMNLVGNAIKFSPPKGRIWIFVTEAQDGVRFAVRDEGIGIPAEAMGPLFDPFFQVDASSTRAHGGMGLGLAIAKNLVTAMGGTLQVESEPGKGAEFWFALPRPH